MRILFFIFIIFIPLFAVLCGCTASLPAVLLPERLDGTPYSSVKYLDKMKEKKNTAEENTVEKNTAGNTGKNTETAGSFADSVNPAYKTPMPQTLPQTLQQTAYNPYQNLYQNPGQNLSQNFPYQHIPNPQSITNSQYPQLAGMTSENKSTANNAAESKDEDIESAVKIQKGDPKQLRHLLADILEIPQEEWKISEKELSERLTAFRQTIKNEKNTELESLYIKQLRNAVLPAGLQNELPDNTDTEISAKKTAPQPKYGQIAQINEPAKRSGKGGQENNNIVPASYQNTESNTANPNVPQPLPQYSPEYSTGRWEQQIRIGTDMLRREIEQTPSGRTFENEIKVRLLESALGNRNEAVRPFTTEEKRFTDAWSNMMLGISTLYDSAALPDRRKRIESAAFRFDECSAVMNQFCPIRLRNVQLVNSWLGFGAFEPKEDVCISGEETGVYLELENPVIKRSAKGYNVSTAITYEIRDMTANIIEKSDKIYAEDTAPSLRHDHCIHFTVPLPQTLPQGQYQLRINVTDMNSDNMQYAEEQIPLRVRKGTPAEQAR